MAESSSPRYQVKLRCVRGEQYIDVVFCSCIKAPFYKKASFWVLKINVSTHWAQQLFNDLNDATIRQLELEIHEIKHEGDFDSLNEGRLVHYKSYNCISATNAKEGELLRVEDSNSEIILTLADHILFDMTKKNAFNKKLKDITAYDAILDYEQKLTERYGENAFWFNKINVEKDKSDYTYEELLLTAVNDQQITDILLYSKKALKNIAFYFFDDFCLDKDCNKAIACHFINLPDLTEFKQFKIEESFDTTHFTTLLKEYNFSDTFRHITDGYSNTVIKNKYMFAKLDLDRKTPTFHPSIDNIDNTNEYNVNENRQSTVVKVTKEDVKHENKATDTPSDRQKPRIIYAPDSIALAEERIKNCTLFIENKIRRLIQLQTVDCYCEWLQFGRGYNFDQIFPESSLFTPIMICNIFYKEGTERSVKHMVKSLMLEYYRERPTCSTCKYFVDESCTLHPKAKYAESSCNDHVVS
jgi:hypothetical protein